MNLVPWWSCKSLTRSNYCTFTSHENLATKKRPFSITAAQTKHIMRAFLDHHQKFVIKQACSRSHRPLNLRSCWSHLRTRVHILGHLCVVYRPGRFIRHFCLLWESVSRARAENAAYLRDFVRTIAFNWLVEAPCSPKILLFEPVCLFFPQAETRDFCLQLFFPFFFLHERRRSLLLQACVTRSSATVGHCFSRLI